MVKGTLARNAAPEDNAASDAAKLGIPYRPRDGATGVWPQNLTAVQAFNRILRLFRRPGAFGGPCGLDYAGVRDGLELAGFEVTEALWCEIQCIEAGAVEETMRKQS